jgi:hypothetical protein
MKEESRDKGGHYFHYNRDERLSRASLRYGDGKKKGFFSNRGRVIVLIDILVLVLLYGVISFFTGSDPDRLRTEGSDFRLTAFVHEGEIYASLKIIRVDENEDPGSVIVEAVFSLDETFDEAAIKDLLPRRQGEDRVLSTRLAYAGEAEAVYVQIRIEEHSYVLKTELDA